jgi:hypothetical protein
MNPLVAMSSNFHPDVVSTTRGNNSKSFIRNDSEWGQLVLYGTQFFERLLGRRRNQLPQDPRNRLERERAGRQFDLPGRCDDIWTFAHVQHQRIAVGTNNGGQKRFDEGHC